MTVVTNRLRIASVAASRHPRMLVSRYACDSLSSYTASRNAAFDIVGVKLLLAEYHENKAKEEETARKKKTMEKKCDVVVVVELCNIVSQVFYMYAVCTTDTRILRIYTRCMNQNTRFCSVAKKYSKNLLFTFRREVTFFDAGC